MDRSGDFAKGDVMVSNERTTGGPDDAQSRLDRLRPRFGPIRGLAPTATPHVIVEQRPLGAPALVPHLSRGSDDSLGHSTRDARGEVSEPVN